MKKIFFVIAIIIPCIVLTQIAPKVFAASSTDPSSPNYVPPDCPNTYQVDFACINNKTLNPQDKCQINVCNLPGTPDNGLIKYQEFGILGITVKIDPASVPSLINLALTTFLGIIALYALFRGIYVAGVKRPQAVDEESIKAVSKELTAIVIGFILAFSFIFLVQLVFNLLGLGKLTDFSTTFDRTDPNTPQLIIKGTAGSSNTTN